MKDLIIIGAGGHGRVIADIAQKTGEYKEIAFLDDGEVKESMNLPVIGRVADMEKYVGKTDFFVAIGNSKVRGEIIEKLLSMGANVPVLIHPSAVIGSCVEIGVGTVIIAGAVVDPCVEIGKGVIVNQLASIGHDCKIGDYTHISAGVHVGGTAQMGKYTWVGIGASVKNNISICENCMVGAGAVVVDNISVCGTYVGVPARKRE